MSDALFDGFVNPPAEAKTWIRWWWNGDRVRREEIVRELDLFAAAGAGGFELNPIAMPPEAVVNADPVPEWPGREWVELVKFTIDEARKRGMVVDLLAGSGWPFGGGFLTPDQGAQRLVLRRVKLKGPGEYAAHIEQLLLPRPPRRPAYSSELVSLRLVTEGSGKPEGEDVTHWGKPEGTIRFAIPPGEHTLHVVMLQKAFSIVGNGVPGAQGPVLDHYKAAAVEAYLERISSSLRPVLGENLGKEIRALFCDSIELLKANWTDDLSEEFSKRRGYAIEPYLPFVLEEQIGTGPTATGEETPIADEAFADAIRRARYDFSRTLVELFHERFIATFHRWCRKNGAKSRYQAYGHPWLMGMLEGYMAPDIPEGDLWLYNRYEEFPEDKTIDQIRYEVWHKYASSGAHLTGKSLVSSEAMTNTKAVFSATLSHIKQADDLSFMTGVNHSIVHGFNYSPPEAGVPGWVRYGTYFSEHNPWWPFFRYWVTYNSRLSSVFQQSRPRIQLAILGPTADVWSRRGLERTPFNNTPWYLHLLWQAISQNGCGADYVSESVIQSAKVEGGKLRCGAMAYETLIVADVRSLEPETAEALAEYAKTGKIIFVGGAPERSCGMREAQSRDALVREAIQNALKVDARRVAVVEGPERDSLLEWTTRVLKRFGVRPFVEIDPPSSRLFQIHQQAGEREVFFFANADREKEMTFTAKFETGEKMPWVWEPHSGKRYRFSTSGAANELAIRLEPLESMLLVFEPKDAEIPDGAALPQPAMADDQQSVEIGGTWTVELRPVKGETSRRELAQLVDFGQSKDPVLNSFGGTIIYRISFDVSDPRLALLDLGPVNGVTQVKLNGQALGLRWYGRHRYDVRGKIRSGRNELEVSVTSVILNYCKSLPDAMARKWAKPQPPALVGLVGPVRMYASK